MKTKEKELEVHSLVHNTSKVKRACRNSRWGLKQMTSKSIIHMDLHKSNNKLVNA
jgi:hypothetical protein